MCRTTLEEAGARGSVEGFRATWQPRIRVARGATPACVNSCIAGALHFGDADDPHGNVSQLLAENQFFRMHEELGTGPRFYYLWDKAP